MNIQTIIEEIQNGRIHTPAYLFDMDLLRNKVSTITEILGDTAKLCYAIKANPFLIQPIDHMVPKYEVCSPGELEICKSAGIDMTKIVFSGINKTAESIETAASYGVGVMTAESLEQFRLIAACAAARNQVITVMPRLTNGSQFGVNEEDIEELIAHREEYPLIHIPGIQYFTGTQKKKADHIIEELDYLDAFCSHLQKEYHFVMEQFEYGTGLWVPYFTTDSFEDEYKDLIRVRDYFAAKQYPYEIILEMGRYPAASCGYFVTKAVDCKCNKGANYCIIDGGIHHISYYGQNMALKTPIIQHIPMHEQAQTEEEKWMLCGSLCTFNDVVARNLPLQDLQIGDYLLFYNIGAYAVTEGGYLFLSRDLPTIYTGSSEDGLQVIREGLPTYPTNTPHYN